MKKMPIEFYEVQRFRQWWVWLLMIGVNVLFLWGCVQQLLIGKPWGNNPMSDTGLIIVAVSMLLLSVAMFGTKLHTFINNEGVYVKLFPFQFRYKLYEWNNIQAVSVRKYNPLKSGGWGWKVSMDGTKYYSMSGNMGLQLVLMNGKKVLIGTRQPERLTDILTKLGKMKN